MQRKSVNKFCGSKEYIYERDWELLPGHSAPMFTFVIGFSVSLSESDFASG